MYSSANLFVRELTAAISCIRNQDFEGAYRVIKSAITILPDDLKEKANAILKEANEHREKQLIELEKELNRLRNQGKITLLEARRQRMEGEYDIEEAHILKLQSRMFSLAHQNNMIRREPATIPTE